MSRPQDCQAPLFVPADRPERFAKAAASGADAVILDLEDAVAPAAKPAARAALDLSFTSLPVIVRINAPGTPWHADDMAALARLRPAAVMVPKAEDAELMDMLHRQVHGVPLIALVETARGLAAARAIAARPGVVRLAFGSVDFCADLGCGHLDGVLMPARFELVMASRLAGIAAPLDGVTTDLSQAGAAGGDAARAASAGMGGKLCIHPRQVGEVLAAFRPGAAAIDWARRVLAAGGEGAVQLAGEMVDAPVRARARAILRALQDAAPAKHPED